jgi:hypothetical protein
MGQGRGADGWCGGGASRGSGGGSRGSGGGSRGSGAASRRRRRLGGGCWGRLGGARIVGDVEGDADGGAKSLGKPFGLCRGLVVRAQCVTGPECVKNDWTGRRIDHVLQRSAWSQAASTDFRREFKKAVESQMHLISVSAHPLEPRAATAGWS